MDALLSCVLQIYRAAQETSGDEFQRLMLVVVQQMIPFRSAAWCCDAGFDVERGPMHIRNVEAFNEPESILKELPAITCKHAAFIEGIARRPRIACAGFAPDLYTEKNDAELREYICRYRHEHNLIIADIATPRSRGTWLSLYRPTAAGAFDGQNQRALTLLMPHLVEARSINRRLALGQGGFESWSSGGARALIKKNGTLIHAGHRFRELLEAHWPGARRRRLPPELLAQLQKSGTAVSGGVRIVMSTLGQLQVLSIVELSVGSRLSRREHEVALIYGAGKSYKEISRALDISPVTVRNVIQHVYRKLGINNKADLVRELMSEDPSRLSPPHLS